MTAKSAIQEWLKRGDYAQGVVLLRAEISNGHRCPLFGLISSSNNSFTRQKLYEELHRIHEQQEQESAPQTARKWNHVNESALPEDLQKLAQQVKAHMRKMDALHGRLRELYYRKDGSQKKRPNKEIGRSLAMEVLHLYYQVRRAYDRIDYYVAHKEYLPGSEPQTLNRDELIRLLIEQPRAVRFFERSQNKNSQSPRANYYREILTKIEMITNEVR